MGGAETVETSWEVGSVGVGQWQRAGSVGQGGKSGPIGEVGGGFDQIIGAGRAGDGELKSPGGREGWGVELQRRVDDSEEGVAAGDRAAGVADNHRISSGGVGGDISQSEAGGSSAEDVRAGTRLVVSTAWSKAARISPVGGPRWVRQ